jgi:hypothetical protein
LTKIFWLSTFSLLSSEASAWDWVPDVDGLGVDDVYPKWSSAISATKAAAGLGALVWLSFVFTLVFFSTYLSLP